LRRASTKLLLLILFLLVADQISKVLVRRWLDPHEPIQLLPFFRLEHVQNPGIAFGWLDGHSFLIAMVSFMIVVLLVIAALAVRNNSRLVWPMAFLVAGSAGNLIDRVANGSVTDFLHFEYWPAFNLADMCIVFGVMLLLLQLLLTPSKERNLSES